MTTKLALTYLEICSWLENVALPSNRALYRRPYNQNPLCSDGDPEVIELEFFNGAQKSFLKAQILESYFFTAGLGYRIFPSSVILSHLIASKPSIVMNRKVLELGAGVGLSGIVASLLGANRTVLSDSIHELLKSLERNAKHNCWKAYKERKISVKYLDWNPNSTNPPLETPTLSQRTFNHVKNEKFDIIIGADILYEFEFAEWLPAVIVSHLNAPSRGTRRSDYKSLEIQPELSANDGKTGQPATVGDESTFASVLNCAAIFVSPTRDMRILNHFVNKLQGVGKFDLITKRLYLTNFSIF